MKIVCDSKTIALESLRFSYLFFISHWTQSVVVVSVRIFASQT